MQLSEAVLSALRAESLERSRALSFPFLRPRGLTLPESAYSDPVEVFGEAWAPVPATNSYDDVRRALRVGAVLAFTRSLPFPRFDRTWWAIRHQCGGHACEQLEMIATPFPLKPAIIGPLLEVAREGFYAEQGHFYRQNVLASRIARYVASLQAMSLDCEASWRLLTESVYPVDATQENLDALSDDPPDLGSVVDWGGSRPARYSDEPVILILAENSD